MEVFNVMLGAAAVFGAAALHEQQRKQRMKETYTDTEVNQYFGLELDP